MTPNIASAEYLTGSRAIPEDPGDSHSSGVSWGAVIGGAVVAAAVYLILLALGAGLGLSAISPWTNVGISAAAAGRAAILWMIFIEIVSSAIGGYMTGRLRTRWVQVHTDEVYFRDTANGFIAWSLALVISVASFATAATWMAGNAAEGQRAQTSIAETAAGNPNAYFVDRLLRSERGAEANAPVRAEAELIFARAMSTNEISPADQNYLAQVISTQTGITQADAEKRINDVLTDARQAEDTARKATARFLLWFFLALLVGAFSASYAATLGGRLRDHVKAV